MNNRLGLLLGLATAGVLVQQQILLHLPPRLVQLRPQHIHSGSAGLDLRFSRPMDLNTVKAESDLKPALRHRWLGSHGALRLILHPAKAIDEPIELQLAGQDRRNNKLKPQTWWWDPRPWLLINRTTNNGQQLQLQDRDGQWTPISPTWTRLNKIVPLGNGRGVAMVASNDNRSEQIWLQPLETTSLSQKPASLLTPKPQAIRRLAKGNVLFAHLSSNLNGDLLIQTGGFLSKSEKNELVLANGQRRAINVRSAGPMELLPGGGGLVVPTYNGINLQPLINNNNTVQSLPGNRELGAFCAASGRALLIRHWPDYRRSIELILPGMAPRQLWLGEEAVLGVACDAKGERIWAVIGTWTGEWAQHVILRMDSKGNEISRRLLTPWRMKGGTPLQLDPVGSQLLLTVRRKGQNTANPALIDAATLQWKKIIPIDVEEAHLLNP